MNIFKISKYFARFIFLQIVVSSTTIWYFDKFIFINEAQKFEIYLSLVEDRERFYSFVPLGWIKVDTLFIFLVTIFLLGIYSTKFYTYVNELDYVYDNKYLDDYFFLYLLWNSYMLSSLYVFRIIGLSRFNLIIFTFIVPLILFVFRNSEIISNLLGRSVSKENYISFNFDEFSNFKNLRIAAYRNEVKNINVTENKLTEEVKNSVDKINKTVNINLVIIQLKTLNKLSIELEEYLIKINKKVMLITDNELEFNNTFIYRLVKINNKFVYYFNNDIQYGAKYILKRVLDISIALALLIFLSPVLLGIILRIYLLDSNPVLVIQNRVGLHGKKFKMFKFRTMYKDSHNKRSELIERNKKTGPLFKLDNDPRVIQKLNFLRKYSLDELPQLFNVLKGDMSLVGPRPLFEEDSFELNENYMRRLNVLPGMTGLLQINDRNTSDFNVWHKYDLEYIENWSLFLDVKILLKTFKAILNKDNSGV